MSDDAPIKDNEAIHDAEIRPLVTRIIAICKEHNIPALIVFEYAPGMLCRTSIVPANGSKRLHAASDLIANGFAAFAMRVRTPADRAGEEN